MTQRDRSIWIFAAVAPTLLVVVAVSQWYRVSAQRLTPWKGGGFGMFSTVESRGARFVRCYLARQQGDETMQLRVPVPPEWRELEVRLMYMPNEDNAAALAHRMAGAVWVEADPEAEPAPAGDTGTGQPAAEGDSADAGHAPPPAPWVRGLSSSRDLGDGVPVDYDHVIVEAWTSSFDNTSGQMKAREVVEVTAPRRTEAVAQAKTQRSKEE